MSSPVTASESCSRISPYLTWGAISMRQVNRLAENALIYWKDSDDPDAKQWTASLRSFHKRLRWHCHFMQKLEDEPAMEFHALHRAYDHLRVDDFDPIRFQAWTSGQTGYPLVDACMRSVAKTGWMTFRMRAMVVSFASYHLWLDWRVTARWLAKHF